MATDGEYYRKEAGPGVEAQENAEGEYYEKGAGPGEWAEGKRIGRPPNPCSLAKTGKSLTLLLQEPLHRAIQIESVRSCLSFAEQARRFLSRSAGMDEFLGYPPATPSGPRRIERVVFADAQTGAAAEGRLAVIGDGSVVEIQEMGGGEEYAAPRPDLAAWIF